MMNRLKLEELGAYFVALKALERITSDFGGTFTDEEYNMIADVRELMDKRLTFLKTNDFDKETK